MISVNTDFIAAKIKILNQMVKLFFLKINLMTFMDFILGEEPD